MQKKNILLLEGGMNEENDVSLSTGIEVKKALKKLGFNFKSIIVNPNTFERDILNYNSNIICFNALHGTFGEDGQIQKILDKQSIKYTHASAKASEICFNKKKTKDIVNDLGILTPEYVEINIEDINTEYLFDLLNKFGPFVIKPNFSGSSYGVKIIKNISQINIFVSDLKKDLATVYDNHKNILIEKYIEGRELTVAVIEKKNETFPVEVTEIISNNNFFDYQSKYTKGFSKHILPANIPNKAYEQCKNISKKIHDKIKCKGVSRSDFIFSNEKIYFLEINSQPGLTEISLVPEQLNYQNVPFDELILDIINSAL